MEFDWNSGNRARAIRHGLSIDEIEGFFRLGPKVAPDVAHSVAEQRFIAVGPTPSGRMAFVAFCWRAGRIRPISARYMHEREVRRHAVKTTNLGSGDDNR